MASLLNVTGAIDIWAAPRVAGAGSGQGNMRGDILYIGTCEQHPITEEEFNWAPVFNDIGGPVTPFDKEFQGSTETIIADLNRFDYDNVGDICSQPMFDYSTADDGTDRLARGSLLMQQGKYFELWLRYRFYGTANATALLPIGVYYGSCNMLAHQNPKQGAKTQTKRLIIEANNYYYADVGGFLLKSSDPSWFTGIPVVPPDPA